MREKIKEIKDIFFENLDNPSSWYTNEYLDSKLLTILESILEDGIDIGIVLERNGNEKGNI